MKQTSEDDIIVRGIKIIDIMYITIVYFFIGAGIGISLDRYYGTFSEDVYNRKSTPALILDTCTHIGAIGVITYAIRNIVPLIKFPLDGIRGYQHTRTKEVSNATIFTLITMAFNLHLQNKLKYVSKRLTKEWGKLL